MIRLIMFWQLVFFVCVGALVVHRKMEDAHNEGIVSVFVTMTPQQLGEISI